MGFILRGVSAPVWVPADGKCDSEKVWPEHEEAHEYGGHWP